MQAAGAKSHSEQNSRTDECSHGGSKIPRFQNVNSHLEVEWRVAVMGTSALPLVRFSFDWFFRSFSFLSWIMHPDF
jgi:hypothetical protein